MGKYIHKFTNTSDFNNSYTGQNYLEPWVSLTKQFYIVLNDNATFSLSPAPGEFTVDGTPGYFWEQVVSDTVQTRFPYGVVTLTANPNINDFTYPLSSYDVTNAYTIDGTTASQIANTGYIKHVDYNNTNPSIEEVLR